MWQWRESGNDCVWQQPVMKAINNTGEGESENGQYQ